MEPQGFWAQHNDLDQTERTRPVEALDGFTSCDALKQYATRLSEVVVRQHAARREDWAQWRAREASLLAELHCLQRNAQHLSEQEELQRAHGAKLDQELGVERRKRIDAEARLTAAEIWRTEAITADQAARSTCSHAAVVHDREAEVAREWKRHAEAAIARERLMESSALHTRHQLVQQLKLMEAQSGEGARKMQAREAAALYQVGQLKDELRSELANYQGSDGRQQLLRDIRDLREHVSSQLAESSH